MGMDLVDYGVEERVQVDRHQVSTSGSSPLNGEAAMTEPRRSARPTKTNLFRVKIMAIVLSGVAFIGSLAGVALTNPATQLIAAPIVQQVASQQPSATLSQPGSGSLTLPTRPQALNVRPLTRTRGS
jgi:hypothetical protein